MTDWAAEGKRLSEGKYRHIVPPTADRFGTERAEGTVDAPRNGEAFTGISEDIPPPPGTAPGAPDDYRRGADDIANLFVDGGTFILDIPEAIPALWGDGDDVLWAQGESLMIAGPLGLGKTTLAILLMRA